MLINILSATGWLHTKLNMHGTNSLYKLYRVGLQGLLFVCFLLSACLQKTDTADDDLQKQLKVADSLYFNGKGDIGLVLLRQLRPKLNSDSHLITIYYYLMGGHFVKDTTTMNLYADSALLFFKNKEVINKYPDEYFHSLLVKGDTYLLERRYAAALDYYYMARKMIAQTQCDDGYLASKLGLIYYGQKNYRLAGRYWAESFNKIGKCNQELTAQELFFNSQGALDNAGVAYEKAGMPDSANYYYQQDLQLINKAEHDKINKADIDAARWVVYDNLGGLNIKTGKLDTARYYLGKCLSLPNPDLDGSRIPPLIKLAELDIKAGNYKGAYTCFSNSKKLLNKYLDANWESAIKWNKLYAGYLLKLNKPDSAYYYQGVYIRLKDSIDNTSLALYRLNVEHELKGMQQQQSLTELQQRDRVKKMYLVGIGVIAALSLVILYMIYGNLRKSRKNQYDTTLHNRQLQQALNELELVNKNYIRIMRIMAHDLRNPLSGITSIATLLLAEDEFSADNKHMLQLIETTGTHTLEMINELLNSQLANDNQPMQRQQVDLHSLLYHSVELLQFRADEKRQKIEFESNNQPIITHVNKEKIWRVFNNLIVNAIEFSHEGGQIRAGIKADKRNITIWITDHGIGIPDDQKESIFEMFTPAKKVGTDGEEPFGLGLSISKRIIEKHNGKIWVESKVGMGTTFYIELPC